MALLSGDEIVAIAMRLEQRGEAFYSEAAQTAASAGVRELFVYLAEQERHHRRAFEQMARDGVEVGLTPEQQAEFQAYADALLKQSFFADPEGGLPQAAQAEGERAALEAALAFEKETLLFFHELREAVLGAGRRVVEGVIEEERRHIQRLSGVLAAA
jgi:rubrerythrin